MFAAVHQPEMLAHEELDIYLEKGWFRMGPTVFTTNFLNFKDHLYSAIWLRVVLENYVSERTQTKLFRQNSVFRTIIGKATITDDKEKLFARYKETVAFEASASLNHLLFGRSDKSPFDTQEISVYDGEKLIANGYFDLGFTSGMGITCFYDPDYKKYSLGKYMIYLKMQYCKERQMRFFYPGYFVPGYSFFDYKLNIARNALEYLQLETQRWHPILAFDKSKTPLQVMHDRLHLLETELVKRSIACKLMRYEFFDANLIPDLSGADLFDFPLFLYVGDNVGEAAGNFIIYNVFDQRFHLMNCKGIWKTNSANTSETIYSSFVLRPDRTIFSSSSVEMLCETVEASRVMSQKL